MNVQYNIQIQPPNRAIPYHVLSDSDANLQYARSHIIHPIIVRHVNYNISHKHHLSLLPPTRVLLPPTRLLQRPPPPAASSFHRLASPRCPPPSSGSLPYHRPQCTNRYYLQRNELHFCFLIIFSN